MTDSAVLSPCLNICKLNASQTLCIGCFRTRDEIGEWARADKDRQQQILTNADTRKKQAAAYS